MTGVLVALPLGSMDKRGSMYAPQQMPSYMGNYISPTPSMYPASYETSPSIPASYTPVDTIQQQRTSQDWTDQDLTLFSHSERAIAKERRREQNRASQRAYRKRKEDTVKGLYASIKDLRQNADTLRAENTDLRDRTEMLQSELRKLHEENQMLRGRTWSLRSCLPCSEAGVTCSKSNTVCTRCEECGLTCTSPSPDLTSRHPTVEASDQEDIDHDPSHANLPTEPLWYHHGNANAQASRIPKAMTIEDNIPAYNVTAYDAHGFDHQRRPSGYDINDDEDSLHGSSTADNYAALLKPASQRQVCNTPGTQQHVSHGDPTRSRSASVYGSYHQP